MSAVASRALRPVDRSSTFLLGLLLAGGALVTGVVAGELTVSGHGASVFGLGAIALVVVLWRAPTTAPVVLLVAALTVEQFPLSVPETATSGARPSDYTDRIPLFHGIAPSVHVSPADLLLLTLFAIWMLKRGTRSLARIPWSGVTYCVVAVMFAVLIGLFVGQAHHGSLRTAFTEIRPYAYLSVAYLVGSVFASKRETIRWVLWALILSTGFKAAQAIVSFLKVRHMNPRPDYVVGHEEALFFGLFILTALALWLFEVRGRLRTVATILLPVVLVADLVNTRRAAWLILGGALIVFAAVGMVSLPSRRRFLRRTLTVLALISAVYFPAYWNHTGALAGPARAVHSAIKPNPRDESSDLYRIQENANLRINIREGGFIGRGFGVPIDYAIPIVNLNKVDELIDYVPHNGVFYILMRMGLLGGIAFWSLLGAGIIAGCRLAKSRDREFACLGALLVCGLVGYALEGYNDQGFFMYRIAFVIGLLLGLCEAARRILQSTPSVELRAVPESVVPSPAVPRPARKPARRRPAEIVTVSPIVVPPVAVTTDRIAGTALEQRRRRLPVSWQRRAQRVAWMLLPITIGCLAFALIKGTTHVVREPTTARVTFVATHGTAWVDVRRGSPTGSVLYAGPVRHGLGIAAGGDRLWAHLRAPDGVTLTLNGTKIAYRGTVDVLLTARGAQVVGPNRPAKRGVRKP